jgi:hypothetical protein
MTELAAAGLARQRREGNALVYQLAHPETLGAILDAGDLAHPAWRPILEGLLSFLALARLEQVREPVRRVEANKLRSAFLQTADRLSLDTPPITRGDPNAWETLMSWATNNARDLAAGTSPALGLRGVRLAVVDG